MVFEQAANTLWSPLVGPSLRPALFKMLASTPGVVVNSHATDYRGRPAIEISRVDSSSQENIATYEKPDGSGVLESLFIQPDRGYGTVAFGDVYLSITRTNKAPTTSPYGH